MIYKDFKKKCNIIKEMPYKITFYCSACNTPRGTQTASGIPATEGVTVAVHPSLYSKNKEIYIEGIGSRKIQDKHGVGKNVIDVYVGDCAKCECNDYGIKYCDVSGL